MNKIEELKEKIYYLQREIIKLESETDINTDYIEKQIEKLEKQIIILNDYKLNNSYEDLCDYTYESKMYDYYNYFEE